MELRYTTLTTASNWSLVSALAWTILWTANQFLPVDRAGLVDCVSYAAAILFLCAPISVLGARRPTSRAWPWFVVLPMIVVLALPLASGWREFSSPSRLQLETPVLVGFALVLLMSTGNYIGTRFTLSALLCIAAITLLLGSVAAAIPDGVAQTYHFRLWAIILLPTAVIIGRLQLKLRKVSQIDQISAGTPQIHQLNQLWSDFRNTFGIVWAKRIEDRMNDVAAKENWPARLDGSGIVWCNVKGQPAQESEMAQPLVRIEEIMRWLLRRFCEPEWIDLRLGRLRPTTDEN